MKGRELSKKYLCCECGFVGKPKTYFKKKTYEDRPSDKSFGPPYPWSYIYWKRTTVKYKACAKCGSTQITTDVPQGK